MMRKILIVDDVRADRLQLAELLREDYTIAEAAGSDEALALLRREGRGISAILLAISMPGTSSCAVLPQFRQALPALPVLAVVGSEDEGAGCLAQGASDYITKPVLPDVLRHCLRSRIAAHNPADIAAQPERKTAALLQAVLDSVVSGISATAVFGETVDTLFTNKKFYDIFGYTAAQFAAEVTDAYTLFHPDDRERVRLATQKANEMTDATVLESRIVRRDGTQRWVRVSISVHRFAGVEQPVQVSVVVDITDEKHSAVKLQALNENLQTIMNEIPGGFVRMRLLPDGRLKTVFINEPFCRLSGISFAEACAADSTNAMRTVHPADRQAVSDAIRALVSSGETSLHSYRLACKDGSYLPVNVWSRVSHDAAGDTYINVYYIDLTEQEKAALERRMTVANILSAIMESSNDYTFAKDSSFRYLCCSPAFLRLVGLNDEKDVVGKTDYDLFPADMAEQFRRNDLALLATGKPMVDFEEKIRLPNKTTQYCRASKYLLHDKSGEAIGIYGSSRDITYVRQMQSQLGLINISVPGGLATYVFSSNAAVRITYCNDGFCELFGGTREGFERRGNFDPMEWVYEADLPILRTQIDAMLERSAPSDCNFRIHTLSGGSRWVNYKATVTQRDEEHVIANAILLDITKTQRTLEQLRMSEEENNFAVQHGGNIVCRYTVADRTLSISPTLAMQHGIPEHISDVPDKPIRLGLVSPETADAYRAFFNAIHKGGAVGSVLYQQRYFHDLRWTEAKSSTIFSADGTPVKAVISLFDVTDRVNKEAIYKKWQQSLTDRKPESYTLFSTNISHRNAPFTKEGALLSHQFDQDGLDPFEFARVYAEKYVFEADRSKYYAIVNADAMLSSYYRGKRTNTLEYRELVQDKQTRWLRLTIDLVEFPNSADVEAFLMFEDIDEAKRMELKRIERSETDPLTGVLNRATFVARIEQILCKATSEKRFALLMLDIDGFKRVNDVFGHGAGDQALIGIASGLRAMVRSEDLVGRLGGDEFMIFLNSIYDEQAVRDRAMQICALCRKAYSMEVQISGSVGIVFAPYDGVDFETLYKKVDAALYYVKGSGKNNIAVYSKAMADQQLKPEADPCGAADSRPAEKKRRMLIVDDNKLHYAILQNIFKDTFIIESAKDGNSALIRLRHYGNAISVVLLDLMMPGMNGFDVLKAMQESDSLRAIPVIIVSGDESREACLEAVRSGATDFVSKPIDPDLLRVRVQSAISKAENERLRAENSMLMLQSEQAKQSRLYLETPGITFIDYNWLTGTFDYYPSISKYLFGRYDGRGLWKILLSDMVAMTATVQEMQQLVHRVAEDKDRSEASLVVMLKTPRSSMHRFRMNVRKLVNEHQLTSRLILSLLDLDYRPQ